MTASRGPAPAQRVGKNPPCSIAGPQKQKQKGEHHERAVRKDQSGSVKADRVFRSPGQVKRDPRGVSREKGRTDQCAEKHEECSSRRAAQSGTDGQ